MTIYERAAADLLRFSSDANGPGAEITFINLDASSTATIKGIHGKHHTHVSTEGEMVSSKIAHVSVSEKLLTDAGYPVRNAKGHVDLIGHKVNVKDSTGVLNNYIVSSGGCYPDEMLGHIVCMLEFFEP